MKKALEVTGLILSIIIGFATLLKIVHAPGSNLLLILGLSLFAFPFVILTGIQLFIEKKPPVPLVIIAGIAIAGYLMGCLFLLMHWPGAYIMILLTLSSSLLVLFIMTIIELSKQAENRKFAPLTLSFLMIGLSLITAGSLRNATPGTINTLVDSNRTLTNATETLTAIIQTKNAANDSAVAELKERSDALIADIEDAKHHILNSLGNPEELQYPKVAMLDNADISTRVMYESNLSRKIKLAVLSYKEFLIANPQYDVTTQASTFFNVNERNSEAEPWERATFNHVPAIAALSSLSGLEFGVRTCELKALETRVKISVP